MNESKGNYKSMDLVHTQRQGTNVYEIRDYVYKDKGKQGTRVNKGLEYNMYGKNKEKNQGTTRKKQGKAREKNKGKARGKHGGNKGHRANPLSQVGLICNRRTRQKEMA